MLLLPGSSWPGQKQTHLRFPTCLLSPHLRHSASPPETQSPAQPSPAAVQSRASEDDVEHARQARKDWATDTSTPTSVNSTQALHTTTALLDPNNSWLPKMYEEAMRRPDLWKEPIEKEMENMRTKGVWEVIESPPADIRTVKTRWTFTLKYDKDSKMTSQKAQLVAKGFTQIPSIDFFESYASVVWYESLCMNFAIAAVEDLEIWQIDYIATYLNSEPQTMTYIQLADGTITRLLKTLYGTMDGTHNWWGALDRSEERRVGKECA